MKSEMWYTCDTPLLYTLVFTCDTLVVMPFLPLFYTLVFTCDTPLYLWYAFVFVIHFCTCDPLVIQCICLNSNLHSSAFSAKWNSQLYTRSCVCRFYICLQLCVLVRHLYVASDIGETFTDLISGMWYTWNKKIVVGNTVCGFSHILKHLHLLSFCMIQTPSSLININSTFKSWFQKAILYEECFVNWVQKAILGACFGKCNWHSHGN